MGNLCNYRICHEGKLLLYIYITSAKVRPSDVVSKKFGNCAAFPE